MRSGSVLSVISSAMCAFLSILATDCTNFANMTFKQKGRVGVMCGCLELFSGTVRVTSKILNENDCECIDVYCSV